MSLKPQFRTHEPTGTTAADSSSNWRARRSEAPSPTTSPVSPRTPRPYGRVTERETGLPELHPLAPAIEDARRIYIGALQYFAARSDLETLLQPYNVYGSSLHLGPRLTLMYGSEKIILSVDPFTSRNTGYCFVDFTSTEDATRAIAELNGKDLLGRAIKTNIATPKKNLTVTLRPPRGTTLAAEPSRRMVFDSWSRDDASEHFSAGNEGRRVRVNGLPSFSLHPPTVQAAMREFFSSFSVSV